MSTIEQRAAAAQASLRQVALPTLFASQVAQLVIPPSTTVYQTTGLLAAGDGGGASYRRVTAEPSHPGKLQDAAGAWFEIYGDRLDVRAFGAKGDCPDVSSTPGIQQSSIIAAVTGATNDVLAFRNALWTAQAIGASEVVATGRRIYRIAYANAVCSGLVVPAGCTLRTLSGSRLEVDYTLSSMYSSLPTPPTGKAIVHNRIGCGDPSTQYEPQWTAALDGWIATAGINAASFVDAPGIDVDMRCHIRTDHRGDAASSNWRQLGVQFRFAKRARVSGRFEGFPNDGVAINGGWGHVIRDITVRRNGYGGVPGTGRNGMDVTGIIVQGAPDLASRDVFVGNITCLDNKDEGLAFAGIQRLQIQGVNGSGNQDRLLEGNFNTTKTAATLGQPLPGRTTISKIEHDGKQTLGVLAQNAAAGATTIVMDDAYFVTAPYTGTGAPASASVSMVLFIPGAGQATQANFRGTLLGTVLTVTRVTAGLLLPGMSFTSGTYTILEQLDGQTGLAGRYRVNIAGNTGYFSNGVATGTTDGPYQVQSVDYTTQTVTLTTAITNAVALGATIYTKSQATFTDGSSNETSLDLDGLAARNIYGTIGIAAVTVTYASGGRAAVRNIVLEDASLVSGTSVVSLQCAEVAVKGVTTRRVASRGFGSAVVNIAGKATKVSVQDLDHDGGLSYLVRAGFDTTATAGSDYASYLDIRSIRSRGNGRAVVRLDGQVDRMSVSDCDIAGGAAEATADGGFLFLNGARVNELTITRNKYRHVTVLLPSEAPITYSSGAAAGSVGTLVCFGNDFPLGDFSYARQHSVISSVQARAVGDGVSGSIVAIVARDDTNNVAGMRTVTVTALPPAAGTYRRGDTLLLDLPSSGSADRARCVTSGTISGKTNTTNAARVATDNTLQAPVGTLWVPGTVVNISGGTNGGKLTVVALEDLGASGSAIIYLNDVLGATVASGTAITAQAPVFASSPALS